MRNGFLAHVRHGPPPTAGRPRAFHLEATIRLARGPNRLTAYCFNGLGVKSGDAILPDVLVGRSAAPPNAYIVAIGIDQYTNQDFALRYAGADADAVARSVGVAVESLGFRTVSVVLKNKQATKERVMGALGEIASGPHRAMPDDLVLVFFAGHAMSYGNSY